LVAPIFALVCLRIRTQKDSHEVELGVARIKD
jgi:predicted secreted protein